MRQGSGWSTKGHAGTGWGSWLLKFLGTWIGDFCGSDTASLLHFVWKCHRAPAGTPGTCMSLESWHGGTLWWSWEFKRAPQTQTAVCPSKWWALRCSWKASKRSWCFPKFPAWEQSVRSGKWAQSPRGNLCSPSPALCSVIKSDSSSKQVLCSLQRPSCSRDRGAEPPPCRQAAAQRLGAFSEN